MIVNETTSVASFLGSFIATALETGVQRISLARGQYAQNEISSHWSQNVTDNNSRHGKTLCCNQLLLSFLSRKTTALIAATKSRNE